MGLRWGIVGAGRIAETFLEAVRSDVLHPDGGGEVVAVCSRDRMRGQAWADAHGVARVHEGEDELAADDEVDAWYVASPHSAHVDTVVAGAEAGVAVLVEKPFAVTEAGVKRALAAANANGTFVMEAMWTRFLPIYGVVRGWLDEQAIGEVRLVQADLGFVAERDVDDRLLNPELAGGAILDTGIYPLALARWVTGAGPSRLTATGILGSTGVDEQAVITLAYPNGAAAVLVASLRSAVAGSVSICGSEGRIEIPPRFHRATTATLVRADGTRVTEERPHDTNGFEYQVREVHRCVAAGRLESPTMTWSDSLALAAQMDDARRQVGAVLPMDGASPAV